MRQIQRCHLLLFDDTFCGSGFPAFVLAFLFAHNVVMFQYDASGFCGHVALSGSHAGLSGDCSLCLAIVCHKFVWARAALDQTRYASNSALWVVFRLPTSSADLVFAMIGIGRQFPLCADISKSHLKNTKQTSSNISKTLTKLLKHVKDTKQTVPSVMLCWAVLTPACPEIVPLPCHVVCQTFVWVCAALDRTGYASNSALSVVFVCQRLLRI